MARRPTGARKKKEKKNIQTGVAHIKATFNNTLVTITDPGGNVVSWSSAVKELLSGKPYIRAAGPAARSAAGSPASMGSRYFFPIMMSNSLEGILSIADRVLLDRDKQIIAGFCKQTALFIENYQLHQHLYRKFNRFVSLSELNTAIAPIQNYETLLQMILEKSAELLKAEQGSLMLLDKKTDGLLLEAKKGIPPEQWIHLRYEDIFERPVEMFRDAFERLGVPFTAELQARCANLHESFTLSLRDRRGDQVHLASPAREINGKMGNTEAGGVPLQL